MTPRYQLIIGTLITLFLGISIGIYIASRLIGNFIDLNQ